MLLDRLIAIDRGLSRDLADLSFGPPVAAVYDPLRYAWDPHEQYLERYGAAPHRPGERVLLVGMNPGPWGMTQTGVPFGAVPYVRDWLGITGPVGKPENELAVRPVDGFACKREEVSGTRVWGWAKARFGTPDAFFRTFYSVPWCPLIFLEASGRNRTPNELPAAERAPLYRICDAALGELIDAFEPKMVLGIGRLAESRLAAVAGGRPVGGVPHPSPASPAANRGWAAAMEAALLGHGIALPGL